MARESFLVGALVFAAVLTAGAAEAAGPARFKSQDGAYQVLPFAEGLSHPWGLAFLPDGRMLVTERGGNLRLVDRDGKLSAPLAGLPPVLARGQGGLLDVAVDPGFAENRIFYVCFAEDRGNGTNGTSLARGRLSAGFDKVEEAAVIFRQMPAAGTSMHFGCRVVPTRDGHLFLTLGDRFNERPKVQDPRTHIGKVVRIKADGGVPADNPFADGKNGTPEVWSLGHRNVQGATLDRRGRLWTVEHGARGGDELNRPEAGKNYGWPVITYGVDYSGVKIGVGTHKEGMEQPVFFWDPSIAPSGLAFYEGDLFPAWKGSLFTGALAGKALVRLKMAGDGVVAEERLVTGGQRIRAVVPGPDGALYLLTDDGRDAILKVVPAP